MADSFNPFFLLPLLLVIIATTAVVVPRNVVVEAAPDLTLVSSLCGTYRDVNGYWKDLASTAVQYAVEHTLPGDSNRCSEINGHPPMYSRVTCSESVSPADCTDCINYAGDQLVNRNICGDHYGAQITFVSCSMRYEINPIDECPSFR
ncbi:unnamed protein product [Linum trigynum]|uniref:Gnk2-homologous domain-containing protein n=1 Tax=Linum trigynum TaxID=586398 RepID=A0AAV2GFY3_9ROSI